MTKILIAEDERDIRELVAFSLRGLGGFEVVQAVDVRMPRMTGFEACRQIKLNDATKDIPIIFLSAKGQESEIEKGLSAGAEEYILKPFAPDELVNHVRGVLKRMGK
jgi:DNA-binding response OmpR family regulator